MKKVDTQKAQKAQKAVQQQAAIYVTRLYSGEMSSQEERDIFAWRQQADLHEQEFQQVLALWELSNSLYQPAKVQKKVPRKLAQRALSVAASVCFAVVAMYFLWQPEQELGTPSSEQMAQQSESQQQPGNVESPTVALPQVERRYIYTSVGEVNTVGLSDGSSVTLNSATVIQVAFTEGERQVVLLEGEAFFDVTSDPQRPFTIDTGNQKIRVVGTKFNVRKSNGDLRVAVVEGVVAVSRGRSKEVSDSEAEVLDDYVLEAGSVGSFSESAEVIVPQSYAQVSQAHQWRKGFFRFDDESLATVVDEFNRYRTTKLRIVDPAAADLRISGVFHFGEGEGLVEALRATLPIEIVPEGGELQVRMQAAEHRE
ncbi:MAG: FecR domain-containing protein [Idiomarina sp.]|nr:FecR domain-containing protein [Idiomarina sp.]